MGGRLLHDSENAWVSSALLIDAKIQMVGTWDQTTSLYLTSTKYEDYDSSLQGASVRSFSKYSHK